MLWLADRKCTQPLNTQVVGVSTAEGTREILNSPIYRNAAPCHRSVHIYTNINKTIKDGDIAPWSIWTTGLYGYKWKDLNNGKIWKKRTLKNQKIRLFYCNGEDGWAVALLHLPSRLRRSGRAYVLLPCVCIGDDTQDPSDTPHLLIRYPPDIP